MNDYVTCRSAEAAALGLVGEYAALSRADSLPNADGCAIIFLAESAAPLPRERWFNSRHFHVLRVLCTERTACDLAYTMREPMTSNDHDLPIAEEIVLRRIGQMEGQADLTPLVADDYDRLRALVLAQTVSTGDEFEIFEIIEIVPPDEPAIVGDETIVEFT